MIKENVRLELQKSYWNEHKNKRPFDHCVVSTFAEQRINFLKQFIDFKEIKNAFDYGCGDGFSCYHMSRFLPNVEGGDISELMLDINPLERNKLHLLDGNRIPFPDNSFDMVYCWEVLHHVEHPEDIVKEMARVSSKYVVLFEPNCFNPAQFVFGLTKKEERGTLHFNKSYLDKLAKLSNLKIVHCANVGWIFPNVTPLWLMNILKLLPLEFPIVTISSCLIAEKINKADGISIR